MKRAIVTFLAQIVAGVLGALGALGALYVTGAHAQSQPAGSAGPGQYGGSIGSVTSLTVPHFAAAAELPDHRLGRDARRRLLQMKVD